MGFDDANHKEKEQLASCHCPEGDFRHCHGEVSRLNLQNSEWEKLVRAAADQLYALGKQLRGGDEAATGKTIQVIATEMHRECGVIKGEEPLPHAGERLTEKPKSDWAICGWCTGTGKAYGLPCPKCDGAGGKVIQKRVCTCPNSGGAVGAMCFICGGVRS